MGYIDIIYNTYKNQILKVRKLQKDNTCWKISNIFYWGKKEIKKISRLKIDGDFWF